MSLHRPPKPGTTLAILLGASDWPYYTEFQASPSFSKSAEDFRDYLLDESGLSLPPENLCYLFDTSQSPLEIIQEISKFLHDRLNQPYEQEQLPQDLIIYYVGHGGFGDSTNEYYLAIRSTQRPDLYFSSIPIKSLAKAIRETQFLRRYIILDSCFSAAAYTSFQAAPLEVAYQKTTEALPENGTVLLCSSGSRDPSKAPPDLKHTMFTDALIEVLKLGDKSSPELFSIKNLHNLILHKLRNRFKDDAVRPEVHDPGQRHGNVSEVPLFPNPARHISVDYSSTGGTTLDNSTNSKQQTLDASSDGRMRDRILDARIYALSNNIDYILESLKLFKEPIKHVHQHIGSKDLLFIELDASLGAEARMQKGELERISETLRELESDDSETFQKAWRDYNKVSDASRMIFREGLELIGGMAVRNKKLDYAIYSIADELINNCSLSSIGKKWISIAVPVYEEALSRTLTRIIRLQFPDWTIWTLPLTAYEFAHVALEMSPRMEKFFIKEVGAIVNEKLLENSEGDVSKLHDRAENHLKAFFADAFATCTMGPAYACAALLQRLDPSKNYNADSINPTDAERAYNIIYILNKMNDEKGLKGTSRPYEDIINSLTQEWRSTILRVNPAQKRQLIDPRLNRIANDIYEGFSYTLRPGYMYPINGDFEGWSEATKWANHWGSELSAKNDLTPPETNPNSKLRDVLNAAWLIRVKYPQYSTSQIENAARVLCQTILGQRKK